MSDTIRLQIIKAICTAMAIIRTANGYNTDAGLHVYRAVKRIDGTDEVPALVVTPGGESVIAYHGSEALTFPVRIEACINQGTEANLSQPVNASDLSEALLGDIIEAMMADTYALAFKSATHAAVMGNTLTGKDSGAVAYIQSVSGVSSGTYTLRRVVGDFESGEQLKVGATNISLADGLPVGIRALDRVTAGLAADIQYTDGGLDEYPDSSQQITGVVAKFNIVYETRRGNPYLLV